MSNFSSISGEFSVGDTWVEIRNPKRTMEIKGHVTIDGLPFVVFLTESGNTHVRRPADVKSGWKPMPKFIKGDEILFAKANGNRFFYVNDSVIMRVPLAGGGDFGQHADFNYYLSEYGPIVGKGTYIGLTLDAIKSHI